jgi:hypothetical protein
MRVYGIAVKRAGKWEWARNALGVHFLETTKRIAELWAGGIGEVQAIELPDPAPPQAKKRPKLAAGEGAKTKGAKRT